MTNQEQIIICAITVEEFFKRIDSRLDLMQKLVDNVDKPKDSKGFLTRKEAALLLKISLPTLNDWTKKGIVISHRIQSRILYKIDELTASLTERNFKKYSRKEGGFES